MPYVTFYFAASCSAVSRQGRGVFPTPAGSSARLERVIDLIFSELCSFFGVSAAPSCFSECVPWLLQVLIMLGLLAFLMIFFKAVFLGLVRGR